MPKSLHEISTSRRPKAVRWHPLRRSFKNGRGDFYDQESRSKHPVLFSRATIRLCRHLREVSRARVAQLFIDVCTRE
ncbi:MAG: hypothetical protein DME64_12005 [Verrucomicrobia bacterium]|nr:MAG: hypothetical protein DME64_12005 [Verrucomicrobiota bacterium]